MKKIVYAVLMLSVSNFAQGATVGTSHEAALYAGDCNAPLDLRNIDIARNLKACDLDAEAKCQGPVERIQKYQIASKCTHSRVWGANILSVSFRATYECL